MPGQPAHLTVALPSSPQRDGIADHWEFGTPAALPRVQPRYGGNRYHLLALMVQLKCFNRMGYFPRLDDVSEAVVAHIRRDLGLGEDVAAVYDSDRTRGHHRMLIRRRSEVVSDIQQDRRRRHRREVRRA
ncbi:DUF4158 domain-containing protein [Nocardia vinacea]|uniref:DUF4158 domain-containing protein n=1 Tax=Nocardia vinacea TaxID=96468 RepID=UPI00343CCD90